MLTRKTKSMNFKSKYSLAVLLVCSFLVAGCNCLPCNRPTLPIELAPVLPAVASSANGDVCFDQANARLLIERELILKGALDKCNITITEYNKTILH